MGKVAAKAVRAEKVAESAVVLMAIVAETAAVSASPQPSWPR